MFACRSIVSRSPRPLDAFERLGWKMIDPGCVRPGIAMPFGCYPGGMIRKPKRIRKPRYRWVWPTEGK